MNDPLYQRLAFAFLLAFALAQAVFAAFPAIDLAVSGLFARGSSGFPWADGGLVTVNLVLRRAGELVAVGLVLWCVVGGLTGRLRGGALKAWAFAGLTVVLASGVIVNLILKTHVGRARPADVQEFGGLAAFTPAWQVTDHCADNCSFVSGEVSLAASLAISAVVLLWPRFRTRSAQGAALAFAAGYVAVVALLRIGLGRHFLSDSVFAVLFSGAVALVLYRVLKVGEARPALVRRAPTGGAEKAPDGAR